MSTNSLALRTASKKAVATVSLRWAVLDAVERVLAFALVAALAPAFLLMAAAIAILSREAPFVAHRRVGRHESPFWVLKFRTMWAPGAKRPSLALLEYLVDENGPRLKKADDPRVTHWFARLCRRHSLDELPQLLHVLSGKMSFVGPRPLTRTELDRHYGENIDLVLSAKPGLTGLWQVMGRNRLTYPQRVRLDVFYVEKRSIALYLGILARTIPQVLGGRDSW